MEIDLDESQMLKVELSIDGLRPAVTRDLEVVSTMPLSTFATAIQYCFEWSSLHLHEFSDTSPHVNRDIPSPRCWIMHLASQLGDSGESEDAFSIGQVLQETNGELYFHFDFTNNWLVNIRLLSVRSLCDFDVAAKLSSARGMSPLEILGGPADWNQVRDVLGNADHPQHRQVFQAVATERPGFSIECADQCDLDDLNIGLDRLGMATKYPLGVLPLPVIPESPGDVAIRINEIRQQEKAAERFLEEQLNWHISKESDSALADVIDFPCAQFAEVTPLPPSTAALKAQEYEGKVPGNAGLDERIRIAGVPVTDRLEEIANRPHPASEALEEIILAPFTWVIEYLQKGAACPANLNAEIPLEMAQAAQQELGLNLDPHALIAPLSRFCRIALNEALIIWDGTKATLTREGRDQSNYIYHLYKGFYAYRPILVEAMWVLCNIAGSTLDADLRADLDLAAASMNAIGWPDPDANAAAIAEAQEILDGWIAVSGLEWRRSEVMLDFFSMFVTVGIGCYNYV